MLWSVWPPHHTMQHLHPVPTLSTPLRNCPCLPTLLLMAGTAVHTALCGCSSSDKLRSRHSANTRCQSLVCMNTTYATYFSACLPCTHSIRHSSAQVIPSPSSKDHTRAHSGGSTAHLIWPLPLLLQLLQLRLLQLLLLQLPRLKQWQLLHLLLLWTQVLEQNIQRGWAEGWGSLGRC